MPCVPILPESSSRQEVSLFSLRQLSFTYPDGTPGLCNLDIEIQPGERIALIGRNGAGKTTLLHHLVGLLTAQQGCFLYRGAPVKQEDWSALRQQVGLLAQDPDDALFCTTLDDDIAFGPRNQGCSPEEVEHRVQDSLKAVDLEHVRYKPAHRLSHGQKKRAALAAILAMRPDTLLLDEPATGLDPAQTERCKVLLSGFVGTLVVIEHDVRFLQGICERAVVLDQGEVHFDGPLDQLLRREDTLRHYGLYRSFRFGDTPASACSLFQRTPPSGPPLLSMQGYTFSYPDGSPGIEDINLDLFPGENLALIGENGAGKSTLALCLLGILRGKGVVRLDGLAMEHRALLQVWRRIGMVFQDASSQLVCSSCREEVAFGPRQLGLDAVSVDRRVRNCLNLVGLDGYADRVPLHLSHGERKRLVLASVLSLETDILILDEPTAELDPEQTDLVIHLLRKLPMAKILISHDPDLVYRVCDRVVVLHKGRIISEDADSFPTDCLGPDTI
ncbi:MAG: ABC transporter ATP-binding protein [Desulfobulbus sp.]|jgi:energy-coupling factor transporter ATP-binding protein EcfA2